MSIETILEERGRTNGDYDEMSWVAQQIKAAIWHSLGNKAKRGGPGLSDAQKESLDMIAHKIARIVAGDPNVPDHWDDIMGYAKLVRDRLQGDDHEHVA